MEEPTPRTCFLPPSAFRPKHHSLKILNQDAKISPLVGTQTSGHTIFAQHLLSSPPPIGQIHTEYKI